MKKARVNIVNVEYNENELTIKVEETTLKINLKDIAIANTVFNW